MSMPNPERAFFNPEDWVKPAEIESGPKERLVLAELFEAAGMPLLWKYQEMLHESTEHRYLPETGENIRKGSGFLQATREIGDRMRITDRPNDVRRITHRPLLTYLLPRLIRHATEKRAQLEDIQARANDLLAQEKNVQLATIQAREMRYAETVHPSEAKEDVDAYVNMSVQNKFDIAYELDKLQDELSDLISERLEGRSAPSEWWAPDAKEIGRLRDQLMNAPEGERLVGNLLLDLVSPREVPPDVTVLPHRSTTERVGTCTTAEVYFLDMVLRLRGYSQPDIVVNNEGKPIMLLKNAGERSAITLVETVLDGVRLPKGSLVALEESDPKRHGIVPLSSISGAQFLRLTSLAVSLDGRAEAVGTLYEMQRSQGMDGFDTVTTEELKEIAERRVRAAARASAQYPTTDEHASNTR